MGASDVSTAGPFSLTPPFAEDASITLLEAIGKTTVSVFILIFGGLGNFLILSVYWAKPQKTSTNILIMGLAGVDLGVCLMRIRNIAKFAYILSGEPVPNIVEYPFILLDVVLLGSSSLLIGIIAFDRYDCVCRPHRRIFNKLRAKLAILATLVFTLVLALPNFVRKINPTTDVQRYTLALQVMNYVLPLLMVTVCYGKVYTTIRRQTKVGMEVSGRVRRRVPKVLVVSHILPDNVDKIDRHEMKRFSVGGRLHDEASTSAMNQRAFHKPMGPSKQMTTNTNLNRLKSSARSRDPKWAVKPGAPKSIRWREPPSSILPPMRALLQKKVTRMLFITSMVLLLAWLPYWVYVALSIIRQNGGEINDGVLPALAIVSLLIPLNSTVNPLIYGLANRGFRHDCKNFFKKLKVC